MNSKKNVESLFLKAYEYVELGEICNAKQVLDELVMEEPIYGRAHYLLGWIYFKQMADYKTAEKHFKLCRLYEPLFAPNYCVYADALTDQDKLDDLTKLAIEALSVPGIDRSYMFYKMAHAKEARQEYSEAIKLIKKSKKYSTSSEWLSFIGKEKIRIKKKIGLFRQIAALL
jgi:tetratricopeptide (TPR) repeat protein